MDKATEASTPEDAGAASAGSGFGNDDLGRLQNILLGDHARQTGDRIDTLEQALLGVLDDLRAELRSSVEALEARIDAEAETRTKALGNLAERVDDEQKVHKTAIKDLTADVRTTESDLHQAIEASAATLGDHIEELRSAAKDLAAADADLGEAKVDRSALAALLSAAAAGLEDDS